MSSPAVSADLQSLSTVLLHTFDPDTATRSAAEAQLDALEGVPGSHALMLQLITVDAAPFPVRQAAALRLKNLYQGYWSIRSGESCKISELDRRLVRENLLEAVVRQQAPLLRVQLLEVVYWAWPTDNPEEWPSLVPDVLRNIQTGMGASPPDLMRVYGSICALRMVLKRYQYRDPAKRAPVFAMVDQTFPLLLQLLQSMAALATPTEESREMCRILVKIFFVSTTIALPPSMLADFDGCTKPWIDALLFLLEAPLPGPESVGGDLEKLRNSPGWKTKKWAAGALLRIHGRFGRADYVGTGAKQSKAEKAAKKAWATSFETTYATRILSCLMNVLRVRTQGGFVTERVLHTAFSFVAVCSGSSAHYKQLKPALPFLIQEAILQQLQLTAADLDLWKNDPQEFIRRSLDLMEEFQDPRMAATGLLFELVQTRTRDTLQLTLNTITHVFETYEAAAPAGRNYLQKEGAMRMFGSLKRLLLSKKEFKSGIESLLIRHVLPEFASPHGFLRQRACWLIRKYSQLEWSNEAAHAQAVRCCVERLQDPELPVKLEAWEATSYIIEHEKVFEYIRPSLPQIIDQFFLLYEEIGNERVVGVLGTLVERFDTDVIPYAIKLCEKLCEMFMNLVMGALGDGSGAESLDDDDEATEAAFHCLKTINAVLYACESRPELYTSLLPLCLPILQRCINDDCIEYYEDVLDMASVFTYFPAAIPDAMWQFLPRLTGSFHTWAGDFLSHMLPCFDNYITKGGEQLCSAEGAPLLQALFSIVQAVLQDQERLIDATSACVLVESLLANLRGRVDAMLPQVIALAGTRLLSIVAMEEKRAADRRKKAALAAAKAGKAGKGGIKKGKKKGRSDAFKAPEDEEEDNEDEELMALKFALLDNIGVAAHYNPLLFSQIVAAQPDAFSGKLFNVWLSYLKSMEDSFDQAKNAVLGLSSLSLLPLSSLPPLWRDAMPTVLAKLMTLLQSMSTLLAEQKDDEDEPSDAADRNVANFQDVDEDHDVYHHSENDDDDSIDADDAEAEGEDDDGTGAFLDDMEEAMLGNEHDGAKFVSPLDDVDPFVFFMQALETLSKQEPAFYQHWIASMSDAHTRAHTCTHTRTRAVFAQLTCRSARSRFPCLVSPTHAFFVWFCAPWLLFFFSVDLCARAVELLVRPC